MSLSLYSFQAGAGFLCNLYRTLNVNLFLVRSTRMTFAPDIAPIYMSFNFMYVTFSMT